MPASEQGHVAKLNIQDDSSTFGVFIPFKKMTAAQTVFHLLHDVILKFGKPEIIRSDKGPGFFGEMLAWITEAENILSRTSAPYHPQSMGLVERAKETILLINLLHQFLNFYQMKPSSMLKEKREVLEAMCGIIEEDYFKRQDQRWYQQMTSGTRIGDNVPLGR